MIPLKNAFAKVNITELIFFAHWLIMGRSQKWPDLRSPISKIRDIRFVGTDDLIIFRKFHNFPWNIVAVARLESYFVVGSLDLTWWPDLTWHRVDIFTQVAKKMGDKVGENPAALRAAVFLLSSKNLRGGAFKRPPPPPSRARVNISCLCTNVQTYVQRCVQTIIFIRIGSTPISMVRILSVITFRFTYLSMLTWYWTFGCLTPPVDLIKLHPSHRYHQSWKKNTFFEAK